MTNQPTDLPRSSSRPAPDRRLPALIVRCELDARPVVFCQAETDIDEIQLLDYIDREPRLREGLAIMGWKVAA